jgi:hypothetical protein
MSTNKNAFSTYQALEKEEAINPLHVISAYGHCKAT